MAHNYFLALVLALSIPAAQAGTTGSATPVSVAPPWPSHQQGLLLAKKWDELSREEKKKVKEARDKYKKLPREKKDKLRKKWEDMPREEREKYKLERRYR